jgi:hypothetical protein
MESVLEKSASDPEYTHPGEIDDRRKKPDRRLSPRKKILKSGRTFWPNGDSSECLVHNLSETGAQLEIRGPVPNIFELLVEGDPWRRSCFVVWRRANRTGVKFQGQSQLMASPRNKKSQISECRRFAEVCRTLSGRAVPSDRELLLEMAAGWLAVIRQLQRKEDPLARDWCHGRIVGGSSSRTPPR